MGGRVCLKLDVQVQGVKIFWMNIDMGGGGSGKLDNFHGRHMCIIPYQKVSKPIDSLIDHKWSERS